MVTNNTCGRIENIHIGIRKKRNGRGISYTVYTQLYTVYMYRVILYVYTTIAYTLASK